MEVDQDEKTQLAETAVEPSSSKEHQDVEDENINPLEALFKKPTGANTGDFNKNSNDGNDLNGRAPQFSFFDTQSDEDEDQSKKDDNTSESSDSDSTSASDSSDNDDDGQDTRRVAKSDGAKASTIVNESEFAKWFWENRGDNNRAWKRRRREAVKEKRQRENRQRGLKSR